MRVTGVLPPKENPDYLIDEQDELLIMGAMIDRENPQIMTFHSKFLNPPYDLELWTGVLKTSLTTGQLHSYDNACRERTKNFLATAVQVKICELDTIATLRNNQRTELASMAI